MVEELLTRREFLALPIEERRHILEKYANMEGILIYYRSNVVTNITYIVIISSSIVLLISGGYWLMACSFKRFGVE